MVKFKSEPAKSDLHTFAYDVDQDQTAQKLQCDCGSLLSATVLFFW